MNKLLPTLVLSLAVGLLVIGIHQTMTLGFSYSYWIFMLCISLLFLYKLIKPKGNTE